jgi:hypothetical protein
MKKPFKHNHTSKDQPSSKYQPSQAPMSPQAASLMNLTDADLQYVQGGSDAIKGEVTEKDHKDW